MLSIIIPAKDEGDTLPKLFELLKLQTVSPYEIIIADANSTDRTREVALSYGAMVVGGGLPGPGRNKGAKAANGDTLLFFDADVEPRDPQFLEKALNEFKNMGLDIATCDLVPITSHNTDKFLHLLYNSYAKLCGSKLAHAAGNCIFVKKDMHDKINGFDESVIFAEDHSYAMKAAKIGNFGILRSVKLHVSTRRFDRDGRFKTAIKMILAELHLIFLGPIKHNLFNYTFGYDKK
ncbi:MAG: glycosyltransferase [uncultured bacterium]|nr:MAG: glycosyltransferase [uncultured bacterium]HBD05575.1 glycosyl transferase family 2 [Candidatus Uhrbacteria bacterium]